MAVVNLTPAQKTAVRSLKGVPYGIVKSGPAHALIAKGVARKVTIQPEPTHGVAVRLTTLGQSL